MMPPSYLIAMIVVCSNVSRMGAYSVGHGGGCGGLGEELLLELGNAHHLLSLLNYIIIF
jgi:hypothetical protein